MYIVSQLATSTEKSLTNLREVLTLSTESTTQRIVATNNSRVAFAVIYSGDDYDERFVDIAEALVNDLSVYNCNKEIGYWKESHSRSKAKPKSEE